jgi:hypothetical protein
MPPEGMVHALRRATGLLSRNGLLIDLHPTPDDAQLTIVRAADGEDAIGPLRSEPARKRHANADAAIATALATGILSRESVDSFVFSRYSDSLDELAAYVDRKWTARFDDDLLTTARRSLAPGDALRLWERVAISALRPV